MTVIAADTFYTTCPISGRKRRHRIELRRMPAEVVKDKDGNEIHYTHGLWERGEYVEKLTQAEARRLLYTPQGGAVPWQEFNPSLL